MFQLADILTKILRHNTVCGLLGLGPETLAEQVASIVHAETPSAPALSQPARTGLLVLVLTLQVLEGETADDGQEVGLMMTLRILHPHT